MDQRYVTPPTQQELPAHVSRETLVLLHNRDGLVAATRAVESRTIRLVRCAFLYHGHVVVICIKFDIGGMRAVTLLSQR